MKTNKLLLFMITVFLSFTVRSQTGNALNFDGTNDYVDCGNILTQSYTKAAWINLGSLAATNNIISGTDATAAHAFYVNNGVLSAGHNGSWNAVTDPGTIGTGTWVHVALTYDAASTTMVLYKNGVAIATNTNVAPYGGGTGQTFLGALNAGSSVFNGTMTDVRLYSVARTPAQIAATFSCEANTLALPASAIAYYQFRQGTAGGTNTGINTLTDVSTNSLTATLNNFALTGATSNWVGGSPVNLRPFISVTSATICSGNSATLVPSGAPGGTYVITGGTFTVNPTANTAYTVTGTSSAGCTSTNSAVANVSVNTTPTVVASSGTICSGPANSYSIVATGAPTLAITGGTFNVSPAANTSYTVTGTNPGNCTSSVVATVSVNTTPTVVASSGTICSGNSYSIVASGAAVLAITGGTFNVSPTANTSYTVTGTNPGSCTSSVVATVSVNASPTLVVGSNTTICSGTTYSISATGAATLAITGNTFNVTPSSTTSYTITGTNAGACTSTATRTVTVNATPTVAVPNYSICAGNSASIIPTGAGIGGTYAITGNTFNVSPGATTNYSVTATSSAGCVSANTATSIVNVSTIIPTISVVSNTTICSGTSYTIVPTGAGTGGTYTINPGVTIFTVSPNTTTAYSITGTSAGGCVSASAAVISVSVNASPTLVVSSGSICSGNAYSISATGAPTLAVNGGTFNVSPSATTPYTVTGTNANGCTSTATSTVTVFATPTVAVPSYSICAGNSASIIPTGAGTGGTYAIAGGTANVSPSATTNYTVVATSSAGCVSANTATAVVTVSSIQPTISAVNATICSGNTFVIAPTGAGTGGTYTITPGTTFSVSPIANTTYSITGTNSGGCSSASPAVVSVSVNASPTVVASSGTICSGSSYSISATGAPTLAITGGTFNVSPSATTAYTVTGTGTNNCTGTVVANVTVFATPTITANNPTICLGGQTATITPSGAGTGGTYTFNPGNLTGSSFTVNPAAQTTYSVMGTSTAGCISANTATPTVSISTPFSITVNNATICAGSTVALVGSGAGTGGTYTITPGTTFTVSPAANTSYTITAKNSVGCTATNVAVSNVSVNAIPTVVATSGSICSGNGFSITASGAPTLAITGGNFSVTPSATTPYTVTGTGTNNCIGTAVVNITVFATPTISAASGNSVVCLGNAAVITPTGAGTGGSYNISGGTFTVIPSVATTYSIVGTSSAGCVSANPGTVTISTNTIQPIVFATPVNITICQGSSVAIVPNGAATYSITGGNFTVNPTTTTSYSITGINGSCPSSNTAVVTVSVNANPTVVASSGSICSGSSYSIVASGAPALGISGGQFNVTPFNVSPLTTTAYTVTGISNGCTSTVVANVTVVATPTITVNSAVICLSGSAVITPTGAGTGGTYNLNPGNLTGTAFTVSPIATTAYSVTGTNSVGCVSGNTAVSTITVNTIAPTITVPATATICLGKTYTIVPSGATAYSITPGTSFNVSPTVTTTYSITGNSACAASNTAVITVNVNSNPTVAATASGTICSGSGFSITPTATATSNGGTPTLTINGGNFSVTPTSSTNYTITGTDANGCSATAVTTVVVNATPTITVNSAAICLGGSVVITPTGAAAGGTYNLNPGNLTGTAFTVSPIATTAYSVTGTSSAGCVSATFAVSNITVNTVPASVSVAVSSASICTGKSFTITPSGGNAGTYTLLPATSFTASTTLFTVNPTSSTVYSVTGSLGGCTSSNVATFSLTINGLPTLAATSASICSGNGYSIVATATAAGTPTLTINGGNFSVTPTANTTYTITGLDANGCTNTVATTITVSATPTISAASSTICLSNSAVIAPTGAGTGGTYTVNPGTMIGTSFTVSPIANTAYSVTGTSSAGCVSSTFAVANVSVNTTPPSLTLAVTNTTICQGVSFSVVPSGATTYTITGGSFNVTPTVTTSYTVTGTTSGCTATNAPVVQVSVIASPTVAVTGGSICSGNGFSITASGAPTLAITGGNFSVTPSATTNYTVTGTSANGCTGTAVVGVTVSATPTIAAVNYTACSSGPNVTIAPTGAGTNGTYTISGGSFTVSPAITTTYSITGTNSLGCISANTATSSVVAVAAPTLAVGNYTVCSGRGVTITPTGAATFTITGGAFALTPTTNGTFAITGSSNNCPAINTVVTTVSVIATPTISVNSGSICSGNSFSIIPVGAPVFTITGTGGVFNVSPGATTPYTVTGTAVNGCTNSAVTTITVSATPTITIPNYSICVGKTATLVASGAGTGGTYTINATTGNNYQIAPTVSTNYTVTGTNSAGCLAGNTATTSVTVFTIPVVASPVTNTTICSGGTVNLVPTGATTYTANGSTNLNVSPIVTTTYNITGTQNGCATSNTVAVTVSVNASPTITVPNGAFCLNTTYTITPSGANTYTLTGGTFTASGNSFLVSPVVNTTYSVTGTGTNNCLSTVTGTTNVTVNPLPVVAVNNGAICPGNTFTFFPTGASTYSYASSTGTISNTITPTATDTYSVIGTSALGCISSNTAVSTVSVVNTVTVSVFGTTALCLGDSTILTANGATSYSWSTSALLSSISVTPVTNTTYTVWGSTGNCTNTAVVNVTVNALPVVAVNSGTVCKGKTFTITPTGASSYTYSTGFNPVITPNATTSYSVTGTDANGCISSNVAVGTVTVSPNPTVTASGTIICIGETATLSAGGAVSYAWSNGQTGQTATVAPAANTTYTVTGTAANGCTNTATFLQQTDPCTAINKINNNITFGLYPNPNSGEFSITVDQPTAVTILNSLGQVIYTSEVNGKAEISLNAFENGIYFVNLKQNNNAKTVKVVKQ